MTFNEVKNNGNQSMKWLKSRIRGLIKRIPRKLRHNRFKEVVVKNSDVSILCNCCIGGTMYNDLGMRFLSPTINLYFGHHGFIDWVNHFDEYRDAELVDTGAFEINENGGHGPICILQKDGLPAVEIHFLHYNSYEEAKQKWFERYERINPNKIFCVIEAMAEHEHGLIDEYAELPYNKIIFTDLPTVSEKSVLHMHFYDKYKKRKSVTGFINLFGKRGYDEYDFANEIFNRSYRD